MEHIESIKTQKHLPFSKELSLQGMPPLLRFWAAAYARYERPLNQGLGFHVPSFPGPLLSPNFVTGSRAEFLQSNRGLITHFNEIVPMGFDQRGPAPNGWALTKQFFLGERKVTAKLLPEGFSVETCPLKEAMQREVFWRLITDGFGNDAAFLRALLPFLCTLEADFKTAFLLTEEKNICGVVSVGIAGDTALVLNEVVAGEQRGRGLSRVLSDLAQNLAYESGAQDAFFWTEHAFFGRHADKVGHYRIFERT